MFSKKNYEVLFEKYPRLSGKIIKLEEYDQDKYQILFSNNGYPILKIIDEGKISFLHSKYNPLNEAKQMIDEYYSEDISTYLVYGFALGYHIEELIQRNPNVVIYIYETNIYVFKLALENRDLSRLLENENIHIIIEEDIVSFANQLGQNIEKFNGRLVIHMPSLKVIPKPLTQIKYLLEDFKMKENTIEKYKDLLLYNFTQNISKYDYCVSTMFDKFIEVPAIIISAGPSLKKNIKALSGAKGKAILMAVGTAVKPLLKEEIEPDFIIMTDPQDVVNNQLENISLQVPIIVLSTANHNILKSYPAAKFIAMQRGYPFAEDYVKNNEHRLVETGGSVATTALDVCLRFGCNPAIFVGQDLAFTNGESHIEGTHFYNRIADYSDLRPIKDNENSIVYTSKSLYQYLKWIERRIKREQNKLFINATEGGAFIEGTVQMDLKAVITKYLFDKNIDVKYQLQEILKDE